MINRDTERAIKTLRDEIEGLEGAFELITDECRKITDGLEACLKKLDAVESEASNEIESIEDDLTAAYKGIDELRTDLANKE